MRIQICAVGRMKSGPELDLAKDYLARFEKLGRAHGLGPAKMIEVEDRKKMGSAAECELLARAIPKDSVVCALDERGKQISSPEFAAVLGRWRDAGRSSASFVIGGADGLTAEFRDSVDQALSFGQMVWPHMLVRVMLAEQLYRAAAIQANTPYHRA